MARRQSSASRSSSSRRTPAARGGSRQRTDGKVDISCPQCAAGYRIGADMLDEKIECSECHRVFFAKSTVGKRIQAPDYTKVYIGFGVAAVAIIGLFVLSSGGTPKAAPKEKPKVVVAPYGKSDHPRARALTEWAKSIAASNEMALARTTDLPAMAAFLNIESSDGAAVLAALQTDKSAELLHTMDCSAMLDSDADMTAANGSGLVTVTPFSGDERFKRNTNGHFAVTFHADGDNVKVTSFKMTREPIWAPGKKPGISTFVPNKDIAKPEAVEITDSAGTRKVAESQPAAVPHWEGATPEQRALADEVVAGILAAAVPDAPGHLFNRATNKVRSKDQKKAAAPRVLNAMFDAYDDVIANHQKLILLTRALYQWTGYAVNYPAAPSGNNEADAKLRQSCVRQWFAYWYRYHNNLDAFFDSSENLDGDDGGK